MKLEWLTIGPTLATELLATNKDNRHMTDRHVELLARDMASGQWREDEGTPIRIDMSGNLRDGQHRLAAVVKSRSMIKFLVLSGVSEEAVKVMDTGRVRTLSDHLGMLGHVNNYKLAAAIQLLLAYERTGKLKIDINHKATTSEAIAYLEKHPSLIQSICDSRNVQAQFRGGSVWVAAYELFSKINNTDCFQFFDRLYRGTELSENDPVYQLRRYLEKSLVQGRRIVIDPYLAPLIIKAWNLYRKHQAVRLLKWDANREEYPIPI